MIFGIWGSMETSLEMPGVLTRAIYHAQSIFAYVVKGLVIMRGTSDSRVPLKIACLRIRCP